MISSLMIKYAFKLLGGNGQNVVENIFLRKKEKKHYKVNIENLKFDAVSQQLKSSFIYIMYVLFDNNMENNMNYFFTII